jgi:hypothetical protein
VLGWVCANVPGPFIEKWAFDVNTPNQLLDDVVLFPQFGDACQSATHGSHIRGDNRRQDAMDTITAKLLASVVQIGGGQRFAIKVDTGVTVDL